MSNWYPWSCHVPKPNISFSPLPIIDNPILPIVQAKSKTNRSVFIFAPHAALLALTSDQQWHTRRWQPPWTCPFFHPPTDLEPCILSSLITISGCVTLLEFSVWPVRLPASRDTFVISFSVIMPPQTLFLIFLHCLVLPGRCWKSDEREHPCLLNCRREKQALFLLNKVSKRFWVHVFYQIKKDSFYSLSPESFYPALMLKHIQCSFYINWDNHLCFFL